MKTSVVNIKKEGCDVPCVRPSEYSNPFKYGTRSENIAAYEEWIMKPEQAEFRARVRRDLKGKRLGCVCHPRPCHCDVLARIANQEVYMKISIKSQGDDTQVQILDPSGVEAQVCSETVVPNGSEVDLVLPGVHSADDIEVGDVCTTDAAPESQTAGEGDASQPDPA